MFSKSLLSVLGIRLVGAASVDLNYPLASELAMEIQALVQLFVSMVHQGAKPSGGFYWGDRSVPQYITDHLIEGFSIAFKHQLFIQLQELLGCPASTKLLQNVIAKGSKHCEDLDDDTTHRLSSDFAIFRVIKKNGTPHSPRLLILGLAKSQTSCHGLQKRSTVKKPSDISNQISQKLLSKRNHLVKIDLESQV